DALVRAWCCLSLGEMGSAANDAVPNLLTALQDDDRKVRAAAGYALSRIGASAMPALVKSLDHVNPHGRSESAHALDAVAPAARRAVPALRQALRDENPETARAACEAVARIATGLQLVEDTDALDDLRETLKTLEAGLAGGLAREQQVHWTSKIEQVRLAI